jgi:hypothetical protein
LTIVKGLSDDNSQAASPPVLLLTILIVLAAGTAFGGLLLLTACMKRYDATYSSAMFVGSFVVSASIMSAVKYDTFTNLDHTSDLILYPVGLATLIAGVCLLIADRTPATVVVPVVPHGPGHSSTTTTPPYIALETTHQKVRKKPLGNNRVISPNEMLLFFCPATTTK